jgi:hypothetical protein
MYRKVEASETTTMVIKGTGVAGLKNRIDGSDLNRYE